MALSLSLRLRRIWLQVHLWLGVGLALAIVPLAASGAVLVWGGELERLLKPGRFSHEAAVAALPASAYLELGRRALGPKAPVAQVQFPDAPGDPVVVVGRTASGLRAAWLDPASGRVREVGDPRATVLGWLHALHGSLLIPEIGRKIVGSLGWAMFVSAATGLWLWWPRNGAFMPGLRWRRSPSTLFNLHHFVGFWTCAPLVVLSLTGVCLAFPGLVSRSPTPAPILRYAPGPVDADGALAIARRVAPDGPLSVLAPPASPEGAWQVVLGGAGPLKVQIPARGGAIEITPSGDPLSRVLRSLHEGDGAILIWRLVLFAGGLAPLVLVFSGVFIWLRRQIRRRRLAVAAT